MDRLPDLKLASASPARRRLHRRAVLRRRAAGEGPPAGAAGASRRGARGARRLARRAEADRGGGGGRRRHPAPDRRSASAASSTRGPCARRSRAAVDGARRAGVKSMALVVPEHPRTARRGGRRAASAREALLAAYRFERFRSERKPPAPRQIQILPPPGDEAAYRGALPVAAAVAGAAAYARDLDNTPPNEANPEWMAAEARRLARRHRMRAQGARTGRAAPPRHGRRPGGGRRIGQPAAAGAARMGAPRAGGGAGGQGRDLRHRRDLDQAGAGHGGDELRQVGRLHGAGQ